MAIHSTPSNMTATLYTPPLPLNVTNPLRPNREGQNTSWYTKVVYLCLFVCHIILLIQSVQFIEPHFLPPLKLIPKVFSAFSTVVFVVN